VLMFDILDHLPARRRSTPSGWVSFDAVCCEHNGNSRDQRQRGGVKSWPEGWSYHCFNCGFTASFQQGRNLGFKARRLLSWLGLDTLDIERINLESLRHRNVQGILDDRKRSADVLQGIEFQEVDDLPPGCELITTDMPLYWEYLRNRCVPEDFPAMTSIRSDGVHWTRPFVAIPFTYNNQLVGWTARFLDKKSPKFISHSQPGYVFGVDLQHPDWKRVLVMEGIFDALSLNGVALMHNSISDTQARMIRSLDREITVVPDQDQAGLELVDRAIELGWAVSMPEWAPEVKDVNDAVKKYGTVGTLLTIHEARETSRIKIELRKKQIAKRLRD
jgi:hypothetical protein